MYNEIRLKNKASSAAKKRLKYGFFFAAEESVAVLPFWHDELRRCTMSWDHGTFGWDRYDDILSALWQRKISHVEELKDESYSRGADLDEERQNLRIARFMNTDGKSMVMEEYLAVEDNDCDGRSLVGVVIYEEGHKPDLTTLVLVAI